MDCSAWAFSSCGCAGLSLWWLTISKVVVAHRLGAGEAGPEDHGEPDHTPAAGLSRTPPRRGWLQAHQPYLYQEPTESSPGFTKLLSSISHWQDEYSTPGGSQEVLPHPLQACLGRILKPPVGLLLGRSNVEFPCDLAVSLLGGNKVKTGVHTNLFIHLHSSILHSRKRWTRPDIHPWRVGDRNVVPPHTRASLGHEERP